MVNCLQKKKKLSKYKQNETVLFTLKIGVS